MENLLSLEALVTKLAAIPPLFDLIRNYVSPTHVFQWLGQVSGSLEDIEEALRLMEREPRNREELGRKIVELKQESLRRTLEEADEHHKFCPY
jgi:hypothetical protein